MIATATIPKVIAAANRLRDALARLGVPSTVAARHDTERVVVDMDAAAAERVVELLGAAK